MYGGVERSVREKKYSRVAEECRGVGENGAKTAIKIRSSVVVFFFQLKDRVRNSP